MRIQDSVTNADVSMQAREMSEEHEMEVTEKPAIPLGILLTNPNFHDSNMDDWDLEFGNATELVVKSSPENKTPLYLIMLTICLGG